MYDRDSLRGGGGGESYARICVSLAAAVSVVTLVSGDRSGMGGGAADAGCSLGPVEVLVIGGVGPVSLVSGERCGMGGGAGLGGLACC